MLLLEKGSNNKFVQLNSDFQVFPEKEICIILQKLNPSARDYIVIYDDPMHIDPLVEF